MMTNGEAFLFPNCKQATLEILHYPSGDTVNGFVASMCGLLNTTWLIAVEGPSVQKEQMPTNHKVQWLIYKFQILVVLSSDRLSR